MISNAKPCSKCKEIKALGEFHKNKKSKDGLSYICKYCALAKTKKWYQGNKEKHAQRQKLWEEDNFSQRKIYYRNYRLKKNYGLSIEDFEDLLNSQDGKCKICGTDNPAGHNWCVDHDHNCCPGERTCGKCIRAILCNTCNVKLGIVEDLDFLNLARNYLKEYDVPSSS